MHAVVWATPGRVRTTGAFCCFWTYLHYRGMRCTWTYLQYRDMSCTQTYQDDRSLYRFWTCLHYRELSCTWTYLYKTKESTSTLRGHELHLDVPRQQKPVLLLDLSTLQGPELHLDVSTYTAEACAAPESVSLFFRSLRCTYTCLHYRARGLCYNAAPRTCLLHTQWAWAAPGCVVISFEEAAKYCTRLQYVRIRLLHHELLVSYLKGSQPARNV
jgi:hypothetical protein